VGALDINLATLNNGLDSTGGKPGGSCTAALFLKAFVEGIDGKDGEEPSLEWAHIDIAGTMEVGVLLFLSTGTLTVRVGDESWALPEARYDRQGCSVSGSLAISMML
jgi:hypothetical protein